MAEKCSEKESLPFRIDNLMQLEEDRIQSAWMNRIRLLAHVSTVIQNRRAAWMNKHMKNKMFQQGDKVLVYNSKLGKFPGKLKLRYSRPLVIQQDLGQGLFELRDLTGRLLAKPINGFRLKVFRGANPTSELLSDDINTICVDVHQIIPFVKVHALPLIFPKFKF